MILRRPDLETVAEPDKQGLVRNAGKIEQFCVHHDTSAVVELVGPSAPENRVGKRLATLVHWLQPHDGVLEPGDEPVAALVEELFPTAAMTDIHAFYGSDGSDADLADRMERMMASVGGCGADRGLDLVPTSRYLFDLT